MTANHVRVIVPTLEVVDDFSSHFRESKGGSVVIHGLLLGDVKLLVLNCLLALNNADNHSLYNVKGWLSVMMWPSYRLINQVVTAKEEFGNIAAKVMQ